MVIMTNYMRFIIENMMIEMDNDMKMDDHGFTNNNIVTVDHNHNRNPNNPNNNIRNPNNPTPNQIKIQCKSTIQTPQIFHNAKSCV